MIQSTVDKPFLCKTSAGGVLVMLLAAVGGCGYSLQREIAEMRRLERNAAEVLRIRSDPDSLAAAALFTARSAPAEALALIERAVVAAPDRPEFAWLHSEICADLNSCNPEPVEARLRQLDPANGLGWFGALSRAFEAADESALDTALAAASRSKRVDTYYSILVTRLSRATADAGAMPLMDAIGLVTAVTLPSYSAVSKSCSAERLERPGLREACRSLSASLIAGDTHISEMVGVAIAKRSWPPDSQQWLAAAEARRVYRYRSKALLDANWMPEWTDAEAAKYLAMLAQHRREQDVLIAQLNALGINPTPPVDWVDPSSK